MPAPYGNQNAAKAKRWLDALNKALARYSDDKVTAGQALDKIAERVVVQALLGDKEAWQEIGNRLDGKVSQPISGDEDNPIAFREIVIRAIDAAANRPAEKS